MGWILLYIGVRMLETEERKEMFHEGSCEDEKVLQKRKGSSPKEETTQNNCIQRGCV